MKDSRCARKTRLLACLCCLLIAVGIAIGWYVQRYQQVAEPTRVHDALYHVLVGLHNFRDTHGHFPPLVRTNNAGDALASWRVEILNWVDASPPKIITGRWDDPANRVLREQALWLYCFGDDTNTNVMAVSGPRTPFEIAEHKDGELDHDAIVLVEVKHSSIHWMEPGDFPLGTLLELNEATPSGKLFGTGAEGFHVGFMDGEVWFLSSKTPVGLLRQFATADSAAKHDREELLSKYRIE